MTRTDSDPMPTRNYESLADYFENHIRDCRVVESSPHHVVLADIPSSGGANMLPGGFGALRAIDAFWSNHGGDVHYVDSDYEEARGADCDRIVIVRGDAEFNGGAD